MIIIFKQLVIIENGNNKFKQSIKLKFINSIIGVPKAKIPIPIID